MKTLQASLLATGICLALSSLSLAATSPKSTALQPSVIVSAGSGNAAPIPVDLPQLSADEIVRRNTDARGGLLAWKGVGTMTMAGTLDAGKVRKDGGTVASTNMSKLDRAKAKAQMRKDLQDGKLLANQPTVIQLPFTLELKRPALQRLEIPFQGQTAIQVFDGSNGWKLRPYLGRHEVEAFNQDEIRIAASQQPLDGALIDYQSKGTQVEVEGAEKLEGRDAYRLKLSLKNGDVLHTWIDAQNFLDIKIDAPARRWNGQMHAVSTYFRDYRSVNGLMIPHRMETVVDGVPGSENIYVQKVALNPDLPDKHFMRPE